MDVEGASPPGVAHGMSFALRQQGKSGPRLVGKPLGGVRGLHEDWFWASYHKARYNFKDDQPDTEPAGLVKLGPLVLDQLHEPALVLAIVFLGCSRTSRRAV